MKQLTEKQIYGYLKRFLQEQKVFPKHVLELDPKNDAVLTQFPATSSLYAITPSEPIYTSLKTWESRITCYKQSIRGFRVAQKMECIYLLGWACNDFSTEKQLHDMVKKVAWHLEPFGLFIFDFYTSVYFEKCSSTPESIEVSDDQVNIVSWKKRKKAYFKETIQFFKEAGWHYRREDESIKQQTYTLAKLKKLLEASFGSVTFVDTARKSPSKHSEHVFVVCQKWRQEKI